MTGLELSRAEKMLRRVDRWLPRRLTTRVTLAVVIIVVAAGFITAGAINQVLLHNLRAESIASGQALTLALGESLANALAEGDLAAVQEAINAVVHRNQGVVYAFAFGPDTLVIHTFPDGFPADLLQTVPADREAPGEGLLLRTEQGLVRDFGYRPLDGLPAEVHLGVSQARIVGVKRQVTGFVLALTAAGCLLAAAVAYGFSRLATYPLVELTRRVQRLGQGHLDERIDLPSGDEVGDLAAAFNQMADEIQAAIHQLHVSEAGYRDLLTAASTVGEGIALICDDGPDEGTFLFVNQAFAHLVGYEPAELLGANAATVLHPDSLAAARATWQAIRSGNQLAVPSELTAVDRHGQRRVLETTGTLVEYQNRRALAWFARDITQRKEREDQLRRRNRELTAINALAAAVQEHLATGEILRRALHQVLDALGLTAGWIFLLREDGQPYLAASLGLETENAAFAFPDCPCGQVVQENRPCIVTAEAERRCLAKRAQDPARRPLTCHATVPIQARGRTLGVLSVAAASPQSFDEAEMNLLTAVGQQLGIALENARLWEELQQKERVRSELLARVIRAQEEERQRIARELHDGIGQSLNALVLGLNAVSTALSQAPDMASDLLNRLRVSTSDTVKELQEIIYDLRPSLLDDLGLCRALRWYAEERLRTRGVEVILEVPEEPNRLPAEMETALFRIGQEAITNISKHAQAHEVHIRLEFGKRHVHMEILDDGIGFDPGRTLTKVNSRRGWGLLGIQERAALLHGKLTIDSAPGHGTRLSVTLPLPEEAHDSHPDR